jgi:soluble lytic murein transglycosylase-like protein
MTTSRRRNQNVIGQLLGQARACMLVSTMIACAIAVAAQSPSIAPNVVQSPNPAPQQPTAPAPAPATTQQNATARESAPAPASKEAIAPVSDPDQTRKELLAYYEHEVDRIALENTKLKALYTDGLLARVDLEAGDKTLADAQAKVAEARYQIAAASLKPSMTAPAIAGLLQPSELVWTTGNGKIDGMIRDSGSRYGVDPYLIFCVISQESAFRARATSVKGAHGLMQLMPGTAARYGVRNPYDPAQSIAGGTRYLKDLLQLFSGRVDLALAGYNAGEGAVMKYGYRIPPYSETQNYVRLISARYTKNGGALLTEKM